MAAKVEETQSNNTYDENACVVCYKACLIYSIGSCNHAVCYECSSRMRVLCLQNECPICRQDLPKVIFTKSVAPFATLDRELRSGLYEKKYRIAFADREIQNNFYRLLEDRCSKCNHTPFIEFNKLKEHVRKVHEMFYCEICTENLKIFSSERRCYSRPDLATHRRLGDLNDKSHKGHPKCDYCELRYLDKDELFRHLRREHYFCHLCDADGINFFYGTLPEMRNHFKSEHFLCEEDECVEEQFTAVFRSEIDLKAHVATIHSRGMSKSDMKQARTIDLEFSYAPRGRGGDRPEHSRGGRNRNNDTQREMERIPEQAIVQQPPIKIDSKNDEQFPSLGGPLGPSVQLSNTVRHITYGTSGLARTKENFPSLGGTPIAIEKTRSLQKSQPQSGGKQYKVPSASSMLKSSSSSKQSTNRPSSSGGGPKKTASDFPALSSSSSKNSFDFPALSMSASRKPSAPPASTQKTTRSPEYTIQSQSAAKKNRNKNELLLEDMILPESSVNMNLVSSKHRNLVDVDYVSMASKVSKVQTVQQKDLQPVPQIMNQSVPKLSSNDNFPTLGLGSASSSSAPQWMTVKSNQKVKPQEEFIEQPKKGKKVHEMPVKKVNEMPVKKVHETPIKNTQNGAAKPQKKIEEKKTNGNEKATSKSNNKENKNENVLVEKHFPTLGSETTPPPGFTSNGQSSKRPPPGFKTMSDTNPVEFSYSPPENASKRNQALVGEFQKALKTDDSMQEFRTVSKMYRDGNYFAKSYYETCKHYLGVAFDSIFPELLALLPDIEKQQSLFVIHQEETCQQENAGAKSKKKNKSRLLDVCGTCKQVLVLSDLLNHVQSHALESNFPQLNSGLQTAIRQGQK